MKNIYIYKYMSVKKFLIETSKPYKYLIMGQIFVAIIWSIDFSLGPYLIKNIIDNVAKDINKNTSTIYELTFYYISLSLFMIIVFRFYDWLLMKINSEFKRHIGLMITEKLLLKPHSFYQNQLVGSITNKINETVDHTVNILRLCVDHFLSHILALSIAVFTLWTCIGPKFSFALISWIFLYLYASQKLFKKGKILAHNSAQSKSYLIGKMSDLFGGFLGANNFDCISSEIEKLKTEYDKNVNDIRKRDLYFIKIYFFQKTSFVLFQFICLWWLIKSWEAGLIQPGDFALILIMNTSIVKCLWNLSRDLREFTESTGSVLMGLSMFGEIDQPDIKSSPEQKEKLAGEIVFKDLSFGYDADCLLFRDMNVSIASGERVGIAGFSGSGKTTFVKLILRMQAPSKGRILIDRSNLEDMDISTLSRSISAVLQESTLLNRSIADNIRFSNKETSFDNLIAVAKLVGIHEYIEELPCKYDTLPGEKGVLLSGGQRQRILIARALLRKAPILILDEATSQLDMISDRKILNNIHEMAGRPTTIIVSHRMATLIEMDRILVFDKGKIVEQGSHEELIKTNGLYQKIWLTQNNTIEV